MSTDQQLPDLQDGERLPQNGFEVQPNSAKPQRVRPQASRRGAGTQASPVPPPFVPDGRNPAYVAWLEQQSMLHDATVLARQLAGNPAMWVRPYANPDPRAAVQQASVWFTAYPLSLVTQPGESFLGALGAEELWALFARILSLIHI